MIKCNCIQCNNEFIKSKNSYGKFCSNQRSGKYRSDLNYNNYLKDNSIANGFKHMRNYKNRFLDEQNHKCSMCGMDNVWNGNPIIFILDHIDGHSDNNERSNLRLICPNCDSQLDTYKSKNKNSDRSKYRKVIKVSELI